MRRRMTGLLVAMVLVSAFGMTTASAQSEPTTTTAPQGPPRVVLVNPGSEPRHVLKYSVTSGSEQRLTLSLKMTVHQKVAHGRAT